MTDLIEQSVISTGNDALDWRIENFVAMGFDHKESVALANSTQSSTTGGKDGKSKAVVWNTPLHWMRVKKALDNGCSHAQALEIFINSEWGTMEGQVPEK